MVLGMALRSFPGDVQKLIWLHKHQHIFHTILRAENKPTWTKATIRNREEAILSLWLSFFKKYQVAFPLPLKLSDDAIEDDPDRPFDYMDYLIRRTYEIQVRSQYLSSLRLVLITEHSLHEGIQTMVQKPCQHTST
jgi:hypothetical protein